MFEHPNSLLLHQCLQAANAGDRQTLRKFWADDIVWHVKGQSPWQGEIKGPDAIFEYLADLGEFGAQGNLGFHTEIDDVMVSDQSASVLCHFSAEVNDRSIDASFLFIARIVARRIQEVITAPIEPERYSEFWRDLAPGPVSLDSI